MTIVGDAGVGKSRLLADFDRWLDELPDPVWWFGGRAAHSGPSLPYGLLHDLFATRFDIHDSDDPAAVRLKWESGVAKALGEGPEAVDKAHLMAVWLGFEIGETRNRRTPATTPQSSAPGRRRASPTTSGVSPTRRRSCSSSRTSTGPTRRRSP